MTATHSQSNGGKTGWPPGLLQDDSKKLTNWFASRIDALYTMRKVLDEMEDHRMTYATRTIDGHTVTVTGPDAEGLMRMLEKPVVELGPASEADMTIYRSIAERYFKDTAPQPVQPRQEPVAVKFSAVEAVLDGIDKTEFEDRGGWWETSVGAEFGAERLQELRELFAAPQPVQPGQPKLDIKPPNESGSTLCTIRWMVETPNGWIGSWDREALEQFIVHQLVQDDK